MNVKKMKNITLNKEELSYEKELELGEWTETSSALKHKIVASAQKNISKKNREARVNIRMTSETLDIIRQKALMEGIGYQTLMGSILHKYAHGFFISIDDMRKIVSTMGLKK